MSLLFWLIENTVFSLPELSQSQFVSFCQADVIINWIWKSKDNVKIGELIKVRIYFIFHIDFKSPIIMILSYSLFTKDLLLRPFSIYFIKPIRFENVLSSF